MSICQFDTFRPDLVDYVCLNQEEHITNLNNAFIVASRELGIPKILDAEDVDVNKPDEKSILTYVASYYHYFNRIKSEIADEKKPAFVSFEHENVINLAGNCDLWTHILLLSFKILNQALPETSIPQVNAENFDDEDLVEKTVEVLLRKEDEKQIEDEKMQDVIKTSNMSPDRVTHTYKGTKIESSKEVQHSRLMPQINEESSEEEDLIENMVDAPFEIEVEEEVETEVMQDVIETWKIPQVKVSHAYIGQGMKVEKGEVLLLIQRTNSDWWQIRKEDGHKGFVPSNYVKEVKPKVTQKVIRKPMKVTEKVKVKKTVMKKEVLKNNSEKPSKFLQETLQNCIRYVS
ncbi:Hypothetical predicted protein [Mytilus galloprovincialis]|uniref:Uncharacterized protein n=1 Tax=Mytilus galloprovincialis TaxID=29158 RepID=A0A8B6BPV7_MYTGA|nr:Hypothetical predicted protein [Mytilus galloprovincialis]